MSDNGWRGVSWNPSLYLINARVLLTGLSRKLRRPVTLDDIDDHFIDRLERNGFDWLWLLGVWQTGPAGREVSLSNEAWRREFQELLPDFSDEDVSGSCLAVQAYAAHSDFGGNAALERFRERLKRRGLRLMLDFVPNHTALDHPWVAQHPDYYVHGTEDKLRTQPWNYTRISTDEGPASLAYGRDPYFPGWPDTLQLNFANPAVPEAMSGELEAIARMCDGVRCDRAMLLLPEVFERTWGLRAPPFWPKAIERARAQNPRFVLIGEVYWDLERTLQQQGFDYTYDKRLYDRLGEADAGAIRDHFRAGMDFQRKCARFLENHDEPRAATAFPAESYRAAVILTYFCPGMRFFQHGQAEGFQKRIPLRLARGPEEAIHPRIQGFYDRLFNCLRRPEVRTGEWRLLECSPAREGNGASESFICFGWRLADGTSLLALVNYGASRSQCYVRIPPDQIPGDEVKLRDLMSPAEYLRPRSDLASQGLYLDLPAWGFHILEVSARREIGPPAPSGAQTRRRQMSPGKPTENAEKRRLDDDSASWKKWGPYLSERQWGTVREDYSSNGSAWDYFSHDQARSRAYRWGEDGLAGISDDRQQLCFALALWNGRDPILKERLFGLTNTEGNHGEDVKEYYYYLDNTPTHSFMKYLYKYPQSEYPYVDLVTTNKNRDRSQMEYELIDTGVFDRDRYFDVFVEYAKNSPDEILIRITVENRGREAAPIHILPTLWFRNTWSSQREAIKPLLEQRTAANGSAYIAASHPDLGVRYLYCEAEPTLLFTENETNQERLLGVPNESRYVKDGINDYIVHGATETLNPEKQGTKASPHYALNVPGGGSRIIRLALTPKAYNSWQEIAAHFDSTVEVRRREADDFYASITPSSVAKDEAQVMRQALAGMLWSKQFYSYDVNRWIAEHGSSYRGRNSGWIHVVNDEVLSMPDKWEYPWYAAWDLGFHCVTYALIDPDFAKQQLNLMVRDDYLHPNGQLPAYEWNFSDVNPPVHAWAARYIYETEKRLRGRGDLKFLKEIFQKLALNFTWWVNRKDPNGNNIFGGGFLGLDNIGVFDRSAPLPTGGHLEQADGTAWMAFYCQCMLQIAIELALQDSCYEEMVLTFIKRFAWIASSMEHLGRDQESMWDEKDGFFYDVLRLPDGSAKRLKVRSIVGLLPLCAATVFHGQVRQNMPDVVKQVRRFLDNQPKLQESLCLDSMLNNGVNGTRLLDLMSPNQYRRVLARMLDESEFLSPFGIRSISRYHLDHPYEFTAGGREFRVQYAPAESDTGMFGGNSNWRGPVWAPINLLIIRSLLHVYQYYGDELQVECPTGSGRLMNLFQVAQELSARFVRIFLRDEAGRRPVYGGAAKFQSDPHWRDYILFYEYFHGDNGAGIGASHQTGWTGVVANLIQGRHFITAEDVLAGNLKLGYAAEMEGAHR